MIQYEKIILRSLREDDKAALAELANNKKIYDNLRDLLPHPYTVDDAIFLSTLQGMNPRV
jgi:ribosomal-protein-alanine N-acetyltransferase